MRKVLFIIIVSFGLATQAQTLNVVNTNSIDYQLKVKQLDEFMRRFNRQDIPSLFKDKDTASQAKHCMMAVFDYKLIKAKPKEVDDFVSVMLGHDVKIAYTDTTWKAVALCNASYKGKATQITLELKTERVKEHIYKWVITNAFGKVLNLNPLKQNPGLSISPVDNEVNFISLKHITSVESSNILNYKDRSQNLNTLSVFLALVSSGQLKIENVQQLDYKFMIAPYYEFVVSNFIRDAMNSGWLISDFRKL